MCLLTYSATPPDTHGYVTVRPHPAIVDAQEALIRELMDTTSPDWIGRTGQAQGRLAALVRAKHNGALPAVPDDDEVGGERCERCLGSGRVMEIDRTFFDGGWMPAYVEVECGECNGLGYHPWDDSDDDPDWGAVSERIAARQAADLPSVLLA